MHLLRLGSCYQIFTYNCIFLFLYLCWATVVAQTTNNASVAQQVDASPGPRPDRIILTWQTAPATSQTVTWRTDLSVKTPQAEIAVADASALFTHYATRHPAKTETLQTTNGAALYHSVNFTRLKPNTLYAYRVGNGTYWSEWFQFRTANDKPELFSFLYLGDAQNDIFSQWSRVIRAAYAEMPKAKFILYAGDLINHAENDTEWHEWFTAGSFIHATIPSLVVAGNHEYARNSLGIPYITRHWQAQFNLPHNGLNTQKGLVYYTDYQNLRIICLNSYWFVAAQAKWLEEVLEDNPQQWTIVTLHYPVFSTTGRKNENLIRHLKPLFDKYQVDLVLQGHEHTYARGSSMSAGTDKETHQAGTVYVTSVSGPKMYELTHKNGLDRSAENTQLYQIITINQDKLLYKAMMVTGELYDSFELQKRKGKPNEIQELNPIINQERNFENTLKIPHDNHDNKD